MTSPGSHPGLHNVSLVAFESLIHSHVLPSSANLCGCNAPKSTCTIFISWIMDPLHTSPSAPCIMDPLHRPAPIALSYHYHHVHHNTHYIIIMLPHLNENGRRFQTVHLSYARHSIFPSHRRSLSRFL